MATRLCNSALGGRKQRLARSARNRRRPILRSPPLPPHHPGQDREAYPLRPWLQPARLAVRRAVRRLPDPVAEFLLFGLKMAWSCLFGAAMLALLILTRWLWPPDAWLHRYDLLLILAVLIQTGMIWSGLESLEELKVIGLYHVVGTAMEVFKTHMGSWTYPEPSLFHIGGAPLFTGFMYGTVGSFIARSIRVCHMRFERYPPMGATLGLAVLIYANFFSHHFLPDARLVLFGLALALFWRTRVWFKVDRVDRSMPFALSACLTAGFVWLAESVGVLTRTWVYPHPGGGPGSGEIAFAPLSKLGAWLLLLIISFVCVTLVIRPRPPEAAPRP